MNIQKVSVSATEINNNNLGGAASPYWFLESDGSPVSSEKDPQKPKEISKTTPTCQICFREFTKFADLSVHNARPCVDSSDQKGPLRDPVRLCFRPEQLSLIEHFLNRIQKEVQLESSQGADYMYFMVERDQGRVFLQRLYFAEVSQFNLENWYPAIHHKQQQLGLSITSPSYFVPLNDSDLKLIQRLLSVKLLGGDESSLSREDLATLSSLERRIDDEMKRHGKPEYFVRLSTRSPKDGAPKSTQKLEDLSSSERLKVKNSSLKVSTSQEVLRLLTRSQRVFGDITNFFQFRQSFKPSTQLGQTEPTLNLILREWIHDFDPSREFRCYVHNSKITAISQYYCYDTFQEYASGSIEFLDQIRAAIQKFHQLVATVFEETVSSSYVFDVIVSKDLSSVQVVELNPFGAHMSSGAALFNWETDRELLYATGDIPSPPFRVLSQLLE